MWASSRVRAQQVTALALMAVAPVVGEEPTAQSPTTVWVDPGTVLWDRPGAHGREVARVQTLAELPVTDSAPGWLRVVYLDRSGWMEHRQAASDRTTRSTSPCEQLTVSDRTTCSDLGWVWLLSDLPADLRLEVERLLNGLPERYRQRYGDFAQRGGSWFAVLRRREQYEDFLHQYRRWLAVDASAVASGRVAAATIEGAVAPLPAVLTHEGVHLLNRVALGDGVPVWLEEGTAGCLDLVDDGGLVRGDTSYSAVLVYHREGWSEEQTQVTHGGPRAALARLREQSSDTLGLRRLLTAGRRYFYGPGERDANYELSSLLTCYLAEHGYPAADGGIVDEYRNQNLSTSQLDIEQLAAGLQEWADEMLMQVESGR